MLAPILGIRQDTNLCVCVFPGGVYTGAGWGQCSSVGLCKKKASMAESDYKSLYNLSWDACPVYVCTYEREGDLGAHSPPRGLLSSWLGLCQAIWGAPVLYGARVKNGNANK